MGFYGTGVAVNGSYRFKVSTSGLGNFAALFAAVYVVSSFLSPRVSVRIGLRRATTICLLIAVPAFALAGTASSFAHYFPLGALLALVIGSFWPSVMSLLARSCGVDTAAKHVGAFNLSWSLGLMTGTALSGPFYELAPWLPFVAAATGAAAALGMLAPATRGMEPHRERVAAEWANAPRQPRMKALRSSAWIANFVTAAAMVTLGSFIPKHGHYLGFSASLATFLIFLSRGMQAASFLWYRLTTRWHFRYRPIFLAELQVIAGMVLVWFVRDWMGLALGCMLVGFGTGMTYYGSLFYTVHGQDHQPHHTGIHEGTLGLGWFIAPLLGGWLASVFGDTRIPFIVAAGLTVGCMILQTGVILRSGGLRPAAADPAPDRPNANKKA